MIRLKLIGLTLVAMFAVMAGLAASASALQWLLDGKPIEKPVGVPTVWELLLGDLAAAGGATSIICTGTDEGTIGPLAHDVITEWEDTGCQFQSGKNGACEASAAVTARAVDLPWLTLLLTEEEDGEPVTVDDIFALEGEPGWEVECTVLGVFRVADECTAKGWHPVIKNLASGVDSTFQESETASCTEGNSTSGMIVGTDLTENPRGHTIDVSDSPEE
jgi:hypothetical protein